MSFKDNEPVGSFFMPMKNVLSLFNGISALHLALDQAGVEINTCYYAEIDKYANKITEQHYPNDVALGDVTKWREWDIDWASIDLVGAGFPCQAWSVAGKQLGDKDERGMLFWTTLEIIAHVLKHNPKAKFLMENVKMKKDFEQYITHHTEQALGRVEKTLINSALVSAQNRNRYYWTNFEVTQPDDKGILLKDVIEDLPLNEPMPDNVEFKQNYAQWDLNGKGNKSQDQRAYYVDGKHGTLPANGGGSKVKVCGGAIRGRYLIDGKRQDHKIKTAGLTEQRLEIRKDEKTNTLTTVQKDNVVVFRPCERIKEGNEGHIATATDIKGMDCIKRVYGTDGKAPTLTTMGGGHREPKIICRATVQKNAEHTNGDKSPTLTAAMGVGGGNVPLITDEETGLKFKGLYIDGNERTLYRKLTPLECERLQTLPDDWTDCVSNTQRYKSIGNGWTVDVIAHIFKCMQRVEG